MSSPKSARPCPGCWWTGRSGRRYRSRLIGRPRWALSSPGPAGAATLRENRRRARRSGQAFAEAGVAKKIRCLLVGVLLTPLLVVKLSRLLFDVRLAWLYIVVPVAFVVGTVVVVRQRRRT